VRPIEPEADLAPRLEAHREHRRHGVQFVRWRPDRTPESCRYEQLEVASPVRFDDLLAENG
jgi:hypothetical protein